MNPVGIANSLRERRLKGQQYWLSRPRWQSLKILIYISGKTYFLFPRARLWKCRTWFNYKMRSLKSLQNLCISFYFPTSDIPRPAGAGVRACMCVCATGTCGPILMDLPRKMPQKVSQIYARPFINGRKMFNKCASGDRSLREQKRQDYVQRKG